MATVKGILGQAAPNADTDTDLYTVPTSKTATVKVILANRDTTVSVRIWVAPNGAATGVSQYLAYDFSLPGNEAMTTASFMLGDGDVVRVRANSANVSFTCTGIEQDE